jgi:hypothetical protein
LGKVGGVVMRRFEEMNPRELELGVRKKSVGNWFGSE